MTTRSTTLQSDSPQRTSRATLTVAVWVALFFLLTIDSGQAGSATWKLDPASSDWHDAQNWSPETVPDSPTDIATFRASNQWKPGVYGVELSAMVFDPGATSYFMLVGTLDFYGAGFVNNSGKPQELTFSDAELTFHNSASAGDSASSVYFIDVDSNAYFLDNSTAGGAKMTIYDTDTYFSNHSTAGNALFTFGYGGGATFNTGTSAGTATFTLLGRDSNYDYDGLGYVTFDGGTAGAASFTANPGAVSGGSLRVSTTGPPAAPAA